MRSTDIYIFKISFSISVLFSQGHMHWYCVMAVNLVERSDFLRVEPRGERAQLFESAGGALPESRPQPRGDGGVGRGQPEESRARATAEQQRRQRRLGPWAGWVHENHISSLENYMDFFVLGWIDADFLQPNTYFAAFFKIYKIL